MKHTPGPWTISYTSDGKVALINGGQVAEVNIDTNPEGEANVSVIASAPELLEALEGLIRLKALIEYPREVSEAHVGEAMAVSNAIRKAQEAIAKAKGL